MHCKLERFTENAGSFVKAGVSVEFTEEGVSKELHVQIFEKNGQVHLRNLDPNNRCVVICTPGQYETALLQYRLNGNSPDSKTARLFHPVINTEFEDFEKEVKTVRCFLHGSRLAKEKTGCVCQKGEDMPLNYRDFVLIGTCAYAVTVCQV